MNLGLIIGAFGSSLPLQMSSISHKKKQFSITYSVFHIPGRRFPNPFCTNSNREKAFLFIPNTKAVLLRIVSPLKCIGVEAT